MGARVVPLGGPSGGGAWRFAEQVGSCASGLWPRGALYQGCRHGEERRVVGTALLMQVQRASLRGTPRRAVAYTYKDRTFGYEIAPDFEEKLRPAAAAGRHERKKRLLQGDEHIININYCHY